MKALVVGSGTRPGSRASLSIREVPDPSPGSDEVVVAVEATALNRADLLQARGLYPPPEGESEIPGLECAGTIELFGPEVEGWSPGDRVMALLAGGGHAERVAVPSGQLMPVPEGMTFHRAAALPEVALTSWTNLVAEGGLKAGEILLVTAAASGVGTFAVQLARELGARVAVAGRSMERLERLRPLGAEIALELDPDLPDRLREATGGRAADVVLELVGGEGLDQRLGCLAPRGRLVLVGLLGGSSAEVDLGRILRRRLRIVGSVLRSRSREEKTDLVSRFRSYAEERLDDGRLRPVVDRVIPFSEIETAYDALEEGGIFGKVVVDVSGS